MPIVDLLLRSYGHLPRNGLCLIRLRFNRQVVSGCRTLSHLCNANGQRKPTSYNVTGKYRYFPIGNRYFPQATPSICDIRYSQIFQYHLSSRRHEDAKSVADKTVQILSESKKKEEQAREKLENQDRMSANQTPEEKEIEVKEAVDATKPKDAVTNTKLDTQQIALPKRVWRRIVKEVKHYYSGFRLLFIDVKICMRYVWSVLNGKTLTRRERKQLVRTTADLFRLVPFMVFIIVPFMEFLLPFALKLFPGLLPSTFTEPDKQKEKFKKSLKAKLEIAKFLQDTVEESALVKSGVGKHTELAKEFKIFLTEIREHGTTVQTADILNFTQLFKDDITLDNMSRDHLLALCKLLELNTIGTNKMIAFQIRMKMRQLKADDRMISKEGIGRLSPSELQAACRARGMRAIGVPEWRLRYQLKQWLDMHLNDKIPLSLLLMSRALYLPDTLSKEEQLKTIISTLPENTTAEAEIHAAEVTGDKIDPAAKLKLIKAEEEAIAREKEEDDKAAQDQKEKVEQEAKAAEEAKEAEELLSPELDLSVNTIADKAEPITTKDDIILNDMTQAAPVPEKSEVPSTPVSKPDVVTVPADEAKPVAETVEKESDPDQELSQQDIEELEDVLEVIAEEKKIQLEKESLKELKEDVDEYLEDLSQLKSLVERDVQIGESVSAKRLTNSVNRMIGNLSSVTDDLHKQKQHLLEEIEVKQVRIKRSEELQLNKEALQQVQDEIEKEKDDVISINELVLSMKRLQKVPDDTKLQKIAEVLDEDKDGQISIPHVLRVLQELGTENVNIKGSQMSEIIGLLKLEDVLDEKEKEEQTKQSTDGPTEKKPASEDVVDASKGAQVEDVQAPPK